MLRHILAALALALTIPARAQIPVTVTTDLPRIIEFISTQAQWGVENGYSVQQIAELTATANQLKQTYDSFMGNRGMAGLAGMSYLQRNYLPGEYSVLMDGSGADSQAISAANAILSVTAMANLSPQQRQIVEAGRRAAASQQTATRSAYRSSSQNYGRLQTLIDSISGATDPAAIAQLGARLNGEMMMISNDHSKFLAMQQAMQADNAALEQQRRERTLQVGGDIRRIPTVNY